jgi:hypothetical protein
MSQYEVGYGKPPTHSQFKPGQSGNPGGKSAEHRANEVKAAELAAKARLGIVQAFANLVDGVVTDAERHALLNSDALRLLKDSEDRGFGAPTQPVDNTSSDGSARLPARIVLCGPDTPDAE